VDNGCCTLENEIWIADTSDARTPRRILRAPISGVIGHRAIAGFSTAEFSLDGNLIFFRTIAAADAFGFHSLNLTSGFIRFVFSSVEYSMIRGGRYRGYIPKGRLLHQIGGGTGYELSRFKQKESIP
jgi:hypothetical protein